MQTIEGWLNVDETEQQSERSEHLARIREEVRQDNPRLTPTQIDLITAVAVEIRSTKEHMLSRLREAEV